MNLKQLINEGYDMTTPIIFLSGQKLKEMDSRSVQLKEPIEVEFI